MSTFLFLVNRARRECGVSGPDLTTLQGTLSKEGRRFADWTNEAWRAVQMHRNDWAWMRKAAAFDTVAGTGTYSPAAIGAADIDDWIEGSFRSYLKTTGVAGEQFMVFVDRGYFRDRFGFSTLRTTPGMPLWLTADADRSLKLWPVPSGVYTVAGEYRRAASEMLPRVWRSRSSTYLRSNAPTAASLASRNGRAANALTSASALRTRTF